MGTAGPKLQPLAIDGGTPVRKSILPYGRQSIEEADIQAVAEVLRSDWLTTGPKVGEFEEAFATKVGARYAVAYSSGTAALHGAAFAANLGPGDETITTPLTFAATANCALYQGATPVFADISNDTLNLDPQRTAEKITPRTRALFPVDYAGHPAEMNAFMALADKHRLVVVEDACHALGAAYSGRRVGQIAHMTVFSMHPVKHITTGEGGMVTTNDEKLAQRLRAFRSHGIESDPRQRQEKGQWTYAMTALGYNYRLPDIACALGLSQLRRLDSNVARRREIAARYRYEFAGVAGLIVPAVRPEAEPAWHLYPVRLDLGKLKADRGQVFRALRAENIAVNVHYIPVYWHPYYESRFGDRRGMCPVAEAAYERLISLPMFHGMSDQDVADSIEAVRKVLSWYAA